MNEQNKKYLYSTIISSNDYVYGVLALHQSYLDSRSPYPFLVIATDNLEKKNIDLLKDFGIDVIVKPMLFLPRKAMEYDLRLDMPALFAIWTSAWSKMYFFSLSEYDKVVCLDADVIIRKNIDDLFEAPDGAGVQDYPDPSIPGNYYITPSDRWHEFPGGLWVIKPATEKFDETIRFFSEENPVMVMNDQTAFQHLYPDWPQRKELHLLPRYNYVIWRDRILRPHELPEFDLEKDARCLHYIVHKPWKTPREADFKNEHMNWAYGEWWRIWDETVAHGQRLGVNWPADPRSDAQIAAYR
jgi:alpha-N-acetylglucosamine transferase